MKKNDRNQKQLEKIAKVFAGLMVKKMEELTERWDKPWFSCTNPHYIPQNITGRHYNGMNMLMLLMYSLDLNYKVPVFLTFKQAQERNVRIIKESHAFPVFKKIIQFIHKQTHEKISIEDFAELTPAGKKEYKPLQYVKVYNVFNLDQTNYAELYPEEWKTYLEQFKAPEINPTLQFTHPDMDAMIETKGWVCPIRLCESNTAYYAPTTDYISSPLKEQFKSGQGFYSTLLHEMVHSTGSQTRLKRIDFKTWGDKFYAREELVAEFTASLLCFFLGITTGVQPNNVAYLKSWIKTMKETPLYLFEVLEDSIKAYRFIEEILPFVKSISTVKEPVVDLPEDTLVIV